MISNAQQPNTIKIFLASSITELEDERLRFSDYIMCSVRQILKFDKVDIELCKWENMSKSNSGIPSQQKIDEILKECDISVFLFKRKAGIKTIHEFDIARETQKTKPHEIFVYICDVPEEEKSKELKKFQKRLEQEEVYWIPCKNIDSLKSDFVFSLLHYEKKLLGISTAGKQERKAEESKSIVDILNQINKIMDNDEDTIASKIAIIIKLYNNANQLASNSNYDKVKHFDLLYDYSHFLIDYGLYKEAEEICQQQISLAIELYGTEHTNTATIYNNIGAVYANLGDYTKALEYYFKVLSIDENNPCADGDTASTYNNVGMVYWKMNDYTKSLEYYNKALEIDEAILGTKHPSTAIDYNNIGLVYKELGDYPKALKYICKALVIDEASCSNRQAVADEYNNIGVLYNLMNHYQEAMDYYHKALEIREDVLGLEHPDTAASYNNIGAVYKKQSDYPEALEFFFKGLKIYERVWGADHPDIAISYNNIGTIYHLKGEFNKALEFYRKALEIDEKIFGTYHPDTATSYNNIGAVYQKLQDYTTAMMYYRKALVIREKILGKEHPDTATIYKNIGLTFYEMNKCEQAVEYLEKALNIRINKFGPDNPDTKNVQWWINKIKKH